MAHEEHEDQEDHHAGKEDDDAERHRDARVASQPQRPLEVGSARRPRPPGSRFVLLICDGELRRAAGRYVLAGSTEEIHRDGFRRRSALFARSRGCQYGDYGMD
jgi:hypothetical protein